MHSPFTKRALLSALIAATLAVVAVVINAPLRSQSSTRFPAGPTDLPTPFMSPVKVNSDITFGSISIHTLDDFSRSASKDSGPDPATKTTQYWFESPKGLIRYYSPDHSSVLWEGRFTHLKLSAVLSEDSEGKRRVRIPAGSLWIPSLSVAAPPALSPVMGGTISFKTFVGATWNSEAIDEIYNSKSEVVSQSGNMRFAISQPTKLSAAKVSIPSCQLDSSLDFDSIAGSSAVFDLKLGESSLVLNEGHFAAAAQAKADASRLDCTSFHTALANFKTTSILTDISPSQIRFKTTVASANGAFLANIGGPVVLPVIGRGRLNATTFETVTTRNDDSATIDQVSISGLNYASTATPTVATFRTLANDIASSLALPDFLSPEQQQLKAIDETTEALNQLSGSAADVLVNIPSVEIKFLTDKKLKDLGIPKLIDFGFGKQEILAFVPAPAANSPVSLVLHLALAVRDTYLSVRPSISFAALSALTSNQIGPGKRTPIEIASFLAKQLAPITTPLTTLDTQIKVPIPTSNVAPVDLTKTIHDDKTNAVIDVKATKTTIAVSVPRKALLIDSDGLHLIAHVDVN